MFDRDEGESNGIGPIQVTPYSPLRRSTVEEQKQQGEVDDELFEDVGWVELEVVDWEIFEVRVEDEDEDDDEEDDDDTDRILFESTRLAFSSFISCVAVAFARLRSANDERNMLK